jgi:hypothetical protein
VQTRNERAISPLFTIVVSEAQPQRGKTRPTSLSRDFWRDISSLLLPIACLAPATCLYALEPFLLFV